MVAISFFRVCQSFHCCHLDSPAGGLSLRSVPGSLQGEAAALMSCPESQACLLPALEQQVIRVMHFAFSSEGEKQPGENPTHSGGGVLEVMDTMF